MILKKKVYTNVVIITCLRGKIFHVLQNIFNLILSHVLSQYFVTCQHLKESDKK